ncbi:helix-turn-helix domain-containing protein [Nesterenkonia populi]|uniref:helix-turn-helix domain-containing protein n=1 Tax=Nesterenkonia populi TaxID=1591087 RepID=UPI0011BDC46F|nr:helix-turn-helix domain-containing protein [Nesterenkonia populi]
MPTVKEAAAELGLGPERVAQLTQRGQLPASKVDGRWIIERSDLRAYKQERESKVSVSKAAAALGLSEITVCVAIREGSLPAKKIDERWLIEPEALEAYKQERQQMKQELQLRATTEEAAADLGLGVFRVIQLAREGTLPARKINGQWLIDREGLEAYKKLRQTPGTNEVGAALGLSADRITDLIRTGRLKASKIGPGRMSHWKIQPSDLKSFKKLRETTAAGPGFELRSQDWINARLAQQATKTPQT